MVKENPNHVSNNVDSIGTNHQYKMYPNNAKSTNSNIPKNKAKDNIKNNTFNNSKLTHFKILHQNIRGLFHKTDELLNSITLISPHVLCLTEHHLLTNELEMINLAPYVLGAQCCRHSYKQGGVSIFVSKDIQSYPIDLNHFNKEKDLEICALKINLQQTNLIIICIYRSPTGDYKYFLKKLEVILNDLYKGTTKMILCGDFNINHLESNSRKNLLESLLSSFNLFSTITFPTRITISSSTLIDNIYIDINNYKFLVYPLINGLSDHDAQVMELTNIHNINPKIHYTSIRKIDDISTQSFTEDKL
jgi:exonuclease III